jgi:hypothetical protein
MVLVLVQADRRYASAASAVAISALAKIALQASREIPVIGCV